MTKVLGVSISLETVVIFGLGVVAGRWILPAIVHGMYSGGGKCYSDICGGRHHCTAGSPGCKCGAAASEKNCPGGKATGKSSGHGGGHGSGSGG